jgi:hypothetical protein
MIGLDSQTNDLPLVFIRYLRTDLLEPITHWPDQHLLAPRWAPDDVVHDQVDSVPFMLILRADSMAFFNSFYKSEGPFIPWLKPREFLAHFCNGQRD